MTLQCDKTLLSNDEIDIIEKEQSIRAQFVKTVTEVGQKDDNLVVLVGDISHFALQSFANVCPGRYYNVGICEPTIIGMGAGLAKVGFYPVMHTIAPFLIERSFEQIKLDFGYQELAGNLVSVGSAFDYANLGCTHHCYDDFALIKQIPNSQIIYPGSCREFDLLFKQTYSNQSLTLFRVPEIKHNIFIERVEFGKSVWLTNGSDATVVVTGPQLANALEAYTLLKDKGISVEIIYVHTIRPLDIESIIRSVSKTRNVVVVEEHSQHGGLAEDVLKCTCNIPQVHFESLNIVDFVHSYGSYYDHCKQFGLTAEGICVAVKKVLNYEV